MVTGTAAPVIALAVIVSAQNASVTARDARIRLVVEGQSPDSGPDLSEELRRAVRLAKARKTFRHSTASYRAALLNLALQSALLAMSLVSIDGAANCVPPWLAIVLAVGGIFMLAVISQATGYAVRLFEEK